MEPYALRSQSFFYPPILAQYVESTRVTQQKTQPLAFSSWLGRGGLVVAIGVAYFLAARLGHTLRGQAEVAIFWPATGLATGALIFIGPRARWPVSVAVAIATVASSHVIGRNYGLTIAFIFINAGEAL